MLKKFLLIILISGLFVHLTAQTVYITKSGKKYHTENCTSLSKSKVVIEYNEAIDRGYTPCSRCKPDKKLEGTNQSNFIPQNKNQVKSKSNIRNQQCEAITKSGKRCKRKAVTGSKYCWQHQK